MGRATRWVRAFSRALGQARVTRRRSVRLSAAGTGRLPAIPVCGSDHRCADRATSVSIPHTSRTVQGEIPWRSPFHPRATKGDGKTAITTSRLPCREGRARPVCRWARELPLTYLVHNRSKPSRLATGRGVEAMAVPAVGCERHDAAHGLGFFRAPSHSRPGLFSSAGKERVNLVPAPFTAFFLGSPGK